MAITVGLHVRVASTPDPASAVDAQRIQVIARELGGGADAEFIAEWMAHREARAKREARAARAASPEFARQ